MSHEARINPEPTVMHSAADQRDAADPKTPDYRATPADQRDAADPKGNYIRDNSDAGCKGACSASDSRDPADPKGPAEAEPDSTNIDPAQLAVISDQIAKAAEKFMQMCEAGKGTTNRDIKVGADIKLDGNLGYVTLSSNFNCTYPLKGDGPPTR